MSAVLGSVLQFQTIWAATDGSSALQLETRPGLIAAAIRKIHRLPKPETEPETPTEEPLVTWAFYRKHTRNLLRRYLYASMQVGRAPNLLADNVGRGWVSSRRVRTFEDALIFVLDVERCLQRLTPLERQIVSRILLQEYTKVETAAILGVSIRTLSIKLPEAIDRLTEALAHADLLFLPNQQPIV